MFPNPRWGTSFASSRSCAKDPNAALDVTFILATHPSVKLTGRVRRVDPSAEVAGDKGNAVRMSVAFDQDELLELLPGATDKSTAALRADPSAAAKAIAEFKKNLKVRGDVRAKIHCGRAAIGYVWFHDLWEFLQSRVFFRF